MRGLLGVAMLAVSLAGCSEGPTAAGMIQLDTRGDRSERDVDVYVATQRELVRSEPVLARVVEVLGDGSLTPGALREHLEVERSGDSSVLVVRVSDEDPGRAAMLCNAVMEAYLDSLREAAFAADPSADPRRPLNVGARVMERCAVPRE